MNAPRPKTGRLPAYGKALFEARLAGGLRNAAEHAVYLHLDCWGIGPLPALGKWPLAIKAEDVPGMLDWRLVAGLVVVVVHQNAQPERLKALCTAVMEAKPAGLHLMNRSDGTYQVLQPFYSTTRHD